MYGIRIRDMHDKYVRLSQKAVEGITLARVSGRFWVEYFLLLRHIPSWLPFSAARKVGDFYRPIVTATRNELYDRIAQDVVSLIPPFNYIIRTIERFSQCDGTARQSISQKLIQELHEKYADSDFAHAEFRDQVAREVTGIGYAGERTNKRFTRAPT